MEKLVDPVSGLDVHRDTVAACVPVPGPGSTRQEIFQTFVTMTADLLALRNRLKAHGVTHAAMESTRVLWGPGYSCWKKTSPCSG